MAFNGSYSISSTSVPGSFTLTDTSTGSDSNLTTRHIFLYQADGTLLTGAFINFPYSAGSSVTLNVLSIDYSLNITVLWLSSSPLAPPSTYSASALYTFIGNTRSFIDGIIAAIQSNTEILNDTQFYNSLGIVQTEVDNAVEAGSTGQQASAQAALSRALYLINNQSKFF